MRAGRLLKLLMMLQTHAKVTAGELANACETSVRTIYRDIDALSDMGVPVYSERGMEGGYRLLDGYRTRLNGLSAKEAEALFLAGLPGPAKDMGLQSTLADAQLKLQTALPEKLRPGADRLQSRFLLDAPNWFSDEEKSDCLPDLMEAILSQHRLQVRYQSWKGERERMLEPLGIVLKGGVWYLVARVDDSFRTYRVSRIQSLTVLDERFDRPASFQLAEYWQASLRQLEEKQFPVEAEVRLTKLGMKILSFVCAPYALSHAVIDPPDNDGWTRVRLPIARIPYGCSDLLRFGAELEVLGPPEVREAMATLIERMALSYQD